MPGKNGKLPEPDITGDGIKISVSVDEWILFEAHEWDAEKEFHFGYATDFEQLYILIGRARDWRIKDVNDALIPFDRAELLTRMDRIKRFERENGEFVPFPRIPTHTQQAMATAFYTAIRESRKLPFRISD